MANGTYLNRVADAELDDRLSRIGAVLIEGAKGCGKTETAMQHCASSVCLDIDESARVTAQIAPGNVLDGPVPRLIDEWQLVPQLWNEMRRAVDARREPGQFIFTGSATPADDVTRHTGAGRVSRLRMRTLTLWESGMSTGQVSLSGLLAGNQATGASSLNLDDVIEETCHGGWPGDRRLSWKQAQANVGDYCGEIANAEVRAVDGVRRDSARVLMVMQSLARHTASQARLTTIASDTGSPVPSDTTSSYLKALERLMVVEPLPSWSPVLRSRARIRTAAKHHFVDPAMSASLLNAGLDELRRDLKTFGFLFESLVLRDLRVYAGACSATASHYLDSTGLEVDIVIDGGYGRWGAVEVKLGNAPDVIDQAADNLKRFAGRVDAQTVGAPNFLAVVTATGYAYTRPDGVSVVPLGVLCP
ncbi:MAG: DUF4143 domain-containing protein [Propionibacteriaceae bacterium]|nr:DUF4143 domain-containing protein [Propionibacteriaceae bacterium]